MSTNKTVENISLKIEESEIGQRLDHVLRQHFPHESRSRLQQWISEGAIVLQDAPISQKISASMKVRPQQVFHITIPKAIDSEIIAQDIALDIVFEDEDLLVINKPVGMVVHPACGHQDSTLVNALLAHCKDQLSGIGGVKRPGIVHRLDKDTSGLMVIAKNDYTHNFLSSQFQPEYQDSAHNAAQDSASGKQLQRSYKAFVYGMLPRSPLEVDTLIARHPTQRQRMAATNNAAIGKRAISYLSTDHIWRFGNGRTVISQIDCTLGTGRTHQIRVHCQSVNCPLIGDSIYGKVAASRKKNLSTVITEFPRQALHAYRLSFVHPRGQQVMTFTCEMPPDLMSLVQTLWDHCD